MYAVGKAKVQVGGGVERLKKLGFFALILVKDIWPHVQPASKETIDDVKHSTSVKTQPAPIVYVTRTRDEI